MDPQLQQIIELQTEQNQLLRKYLWRIRFSLLTLLILTTAICCGLGVVVYYEHTTPGPVQPSPSPAPPQIGAPPRPADDLFGLRNLPNSTPVELKMRRA